MLVVTGATGALGRAIVLQLLERHATGEIAVSVRDPEKARDLAELGIRVRRGDFAEPPTLAHAFEGASQLLLVSSNAASYGGDPIAQHRSAIDAARVAGVRRIVYTSHMAASSRSAFPPASERLGRPITRHVRSDDDLRAAMIGRGMPIRVIDVVLGLYRASRAAEFATVDPTLRHMLGRNPSSMRDLIAKTIG